MFSVGDTVVYGTQGVCRIDEVRLMKSGGTKAEYFVLHPIGDSRSAVFVPVGNEKLTAKMHATLSESELAEIIRSASADEREWIENDNERKQYCDRTLKSGERRELVRLIDMMNKHREELSTQKRSFHNIDAQYLKAAAFMLHSELSYVLGIDPDDVPEYIQGLCL